MHKGLVHEQEVWLQPKWSRVDEYKDVSRGTAVKPCDIGRRHISNGDNKRRMIALHIKVLQRERTHHCAVWIKPQPLAHIVYNALINMIIPRKRVSCIAMQNTCRDPRMESRHIVWVIPICPWLKERFDMVSSKGAVMLVQDSHDVTVG